MLSDSETIEMQNAIIILLNAEVYQLKIDYRDAMSWLKDIEKYTIKLLKTLENK